MIALQLKRDNSSFRVGLRLPATPAEVGEAFSQLDSISTSAPTIIAGVAGDIPNLSNYLTGKEIDSNDTLPKLNMLGEQIGSMTASKRQTFSGALDAESINGLDDILRVAENIGSYTLLEGVSNDRELGLFLVNCGYTSFPEDVLPYLDYAVIGAEYYADHGGAYSSAGYVKRKEGFGLSEPSEDVVFRLELQNGERYAFWLELPTDDEEIERAKRQLRADDFTQCDIKRTDYIPYLKELVPSDCISVEEANELAQFIQEMRQTDGELMKYLSALSLEQPETFSEALEIATQLDSYERVPSDPEEYGREILRNIGADDELLDTIDGYMDFAGLGEATMAEEDIVQTEFGLIRRCVDPFEEEESFEQTLM